MSTEAEHESTTRRVLVRMDDAGGNETRPDAVAVEEPLEIRVGNTPFVVTMRTPGADEELAAGFLVTEGIIRDRSEIKQISRCPGSPVPGNTIRLDLDGTSGAPEPRSDRHGAVTASCGVCGKTSIEAVHVRFPGIASQIAIGRRLLMRLPERMREAQEVFALTGGLHAAAIFDLEGNLVCLREDVGRHNALDKVIGHAFLNGPWPLDRHVLVVSGRVAFEIMQKALAARLAIVGAVSAPSSLAISFALESGQTLVGFLRDPTCNVYAHPQRIT